MSVSIMVVDDHVAELFRQWFRRETRQGPYVPHYATSGTAALDRLASEIEPALVAVLINMHGTGCNCSGRSSRGSPTCQS
jgi:two-component system, response regulator, stage 0 sporulation protein F